MRGPATTLERFAHRLESGLLTVPEVASAVLNLLADAPDRAGLWAAAPAALRGAVLAYLAEVGAAGVPPAFWIGPGEPDPVRRAAHTVRRRAVTAELLADAELLFGGGGTRMRVKLLDVLHYPRPGWRPWHIIETPNPDWPTIEAAIRQLDRLEWPSVTLHTVAPVDGKVPIDALTVMGGRGEYALIWSEDTDEIFYEDSSRGRSNVRIQESDQGSVMEERSLCNDLDRVLAVAWHFAERAELDPSVTWVRW